MEGDAMTVLQVYYREVYGRALCYPSNPTAHLFSQLTQTRTLDHNALRIAKELGHPALEAFRREKEEEHDRATRRRMALAEDSHT
jgi:hypothetical protein